MDPAVSVVNLEDETQLAGDGTNQTQLEQNLVRIPSAVGNLISEHSSGVCSSPPDTCLSHLPGDPTLAPQTCGQNDGEQLIRDVIDQLERQCSKSEEVLIELGDANAVHTWRGGAVPLVNSLWIPSARTREILASLPASTDGRLCYTMPAIMLEDSLGDPVVEAVKKHCEDWSSVTSSTRGHLSTAAQINIPNLLKLVESGNFRAAIDMTGKLLKGYGQGKDKAHQPSRHTEESLKVWCLRLHLLVSVGQYNLASSELEAFGNMDGPDLYFEYYPEAYPDRKGSMVPFSMRLLHAELPRFLIGQHPESLARLNRILAVIGQIIKDISDGANEATKDGLALWRRRLGKTQHALARCFLTMKEFRLAAVIYEEILSDDEDCQLSSAGRANLILGDLTAARTQFQKFQAHGNDAKSKCWMQMHNGYVNVANNNFSEAATDFNKAAQYDPSNTYAINNAAICLLYLGRLDEAVKTLESAVDKWPQSALQDAICTNLCTLYELASAKSAHKKITLLKCVYDYKGDGFNATCLKLPA